MNIYIYEALADIEIRLMELISEVKILREQAYYTYVGSEDDEEITDLLDAERLEAFEYLVKQDK